ncbi:hypothetical protein [Streptomyces sp. 1-11]|uniref:hypothetical protein n=1 Tax=Streptomyces sp. 1-11 TaxID=2590549 RepID=UPI00116B31B5|nr:hypothetical protein [Streptomyces sp. 1-11]GEK00356.1 hypothetical protein TNCT1_26320 [Streptomyces sp. 1-11]
MTAGSSSAGSSGAGNKGGGQGGAKGFHLGTKPERLGKAAKERTRKKVSEIKGKSFTLIKKSKQGRGGWK